MVVAGIVAGGIIGARAAGQAAPIVMRVMIGIVIMPPGAPVVVAGVTAAAGTAVIRIVTTIVVVAFIMATALAMIGMRDTDYRQDSKGYTAGTQAERRQRDAGERAGSIAFAAIHVRSPD